MSKPAAPAPNGSGSVFSKNLWPSVTLRECAVLVVLYPFITASSYASSIYALLCGNAIAVALHLIDWLKELSMAKKISERTSKGRERLDGFFQQIIFAIRTALILLFLFSLKFTFLAIVGTIHAIYAALFQKDGSVTGRAIRFVANSLSKIVVGSEVFGGDGSADGFSYAAFTSNNNGGASAAAADENTEIAGLDDETIVQEQHAKEEANNKDSTTAAATPKAPASPTTAKKATADYIRASAAARGLNPNYGSGAKRKSSVKGGGANDGANKKCEVIHEGPHFNRVSRGCLLPIIE